MTEQFSIIRADITHLELVAVLFDRYRQFYQQTSNLSGAQTFIRERLASEESIIFLALDGESADVGFTQLYPSFSSIALRRIWILNDLFVLPEARKQGIAGALLDRAKDWAIETGAKRLVLSTAIDNHAAQHLYEKLGYSRDEEYDHYELAID